MSTQADLDYVAGANPAQTAAAQAAAAQAAQASTNTAALQNAVYGSGAGVSLSGTQDQINGGLSGLSLGDTLYGQNMSQTGQQAQQYNQMVQGNLGKDSAQSDIARQAAQAQVALGNNKAGLSDTDTTGASEQAARGASMQAAGINQQFQNQALNTFGKNVGATQVGQSSLLASGQAVGQAGTPLAVPQQSSSSVICTELKDQGKISVEDWINASKFRANISKETFIGYLILAAPMVKLMKKSSFVSSLWVGWAKSIATQKPGVIIKTLLLLCWVVGNVRKTKKEKNARIITA